MAGGIVIAVILVVVFPVMVMMSLTLVAALLGTTTKNSVDGQHEGSELLEVSETDFYT
jgi:hypothetical protein